MYNNRRNPSLISRKHHQRGAVLMELVVASSIIAVVMAAVGFYFVYHVGTMNSGRAQLKLQRVGSLVMEEMARAIREGRTTDLEEENTVYSQLMITYPNASAHCFKLEGTDIKEGPDYNSLTPLEVLDDSQTVGSDTRIHRIICDDLQFKREADRVIIKFILRHDLDNGDGPDDLTIDFGSAVKLRG